MLLDILWVYFGWWYKLILQSGVFLWLRGTSLDYFIETRAHGQPVWPKWRTAKWRNHSFCCLEFTSWGKRRGHDTMERSVTLNFTIRDVGRCEIALPACLCEIKLGLEVLITLGAPAHFESLCDKDWWTKKASYLFLLENQLTWSCFWFWLFCCLRYSQVTVQMHHKNIGDNTARASGDGTSETVAIWSVSSKVPVLQGICLGLYLRREQPGRSEEGWVLESSPKVWTCYLELSFGCQTQFSPKNLAIPFHSNLCSACATTVMDGNKVISLWG